MFLNGKLECTEYPNVCNCKFIVHNLKLLTVHRFIYSKCSYSVSCLCIKLVYCYLFTDLATHVVVSSQRKTFP